MYNNMMDAQAPGTHIKRITIETIVTPRSRLTAIFLAPAILAAGYAMIFFKGHNTYPFSLEHLLVFSVIAGPFAFFISYKFWKALGTKVIFTDQKIIKKTTSGKEIHLNWSDLKKINITKNPEMNCFYFVFSRKKRLVPFANASRIFCPPARFFGKTNLSNEAIRFILKKINLYKIPVDGNREFLDELSIVTGINI